MIIIKTTNNTGTNNNNIRSLVTCNFLKINKWINEQIKMKNKYIPHAHNNNLNIKLKHK